MKRYPGSDQSAVESVSVDIADHELFVLLGPSGCGKSTLLKMIAGLEEPTSGEIYLDGRLTNFRSPGERNVAMVFQNYALYPHMSVGGNVRFPLKMRRESRSRIEDAVSSVAARLGLDGLLDRPVGSLSGGQRQRVAVARAIVRRPSVMLMDEPLSNLDALLRLQTREELLKLQRASPGTIVYVTHDQIEAMTMGDRIGIMNNGRLVQVGTPLEVYRCPADRFVAGFLGSPPMSFLEGELRRGDDECLVFASEDLRVRLDSQATQAALKQPAHPRVTLGIRPETVELATNGSPRGQRCTVDLVENLGAEQLIRLRTGQQVLRARVGAGVRVTEGEQVSVEFVPEQLHLFDEAGRNMLLATADRANGASGMATTVDSLEHGLEDDH